MVSPSVDLASGPNGRGLFAISNVAARELGAGGGLSTLPVHQTFLNQAALGDAGCSKIRGLRRWPSDVVSSRSHLRCA